MTTTLDTKYNTVVDDVFVKEYVKKMVDKIYKLLPLREEGNGSIQKYHNSIMCEFTGFSKLFVNMSEKSELISLMSSLENILTIEDIQFYRSKVFECINLAKRLNLGGISWGHLTLIEQECHLKETLL